MSVADSILRLMVGVGLGRAKLPAEEQGGGSRTRLDPKTGQQVKMEVHSTPGPGYTCKICGVPGHWIQVRAHTYVHTYGLFPYDPII